MAALSQNNPLLVGLAIYCVFTTFVFLPLYARYVQSASSNVTSINVTSNYDSSATATSQVRGVSYFEALWITTTVEFPWWFSFLFIALPDALLAVVLYDKLRGI